MISFSKFYNLREARVLNPKDKDPKPLKDADTIRVYHAFNNPQDLYDILEYGTSGKLRAKRIYSYESNNNPNGLFVTIDYKTAKSFGQYIAEFHTKVSDLEAPVWPGGSYTVQGEYSKYWSDENPRESGTKKAREEAEKSKYDYVRDSDRPELAEMLYNNYEHQALYTGDLNPNSIRAIWVNTDMEKDGRFSTYKRMSIKEFLKNYKKQDTDEHRNKLFKPREEFDPDVMIARYKKRFNDSDNKFFSTEYILKGFRMIDDIALHTYFWPKQLADVKKFLKSLEEGD
jgi:hypothetical protein